MIKATVIADSMSGGGKRITTLSLIYPRFILAELNTHRMLSRNSASSRAIPTLKLLDEIQKECAWPVYWGKNKPGMQASEELDILDRVTAMMIWSNARNGALKQALELQKLGAHKQLVNRIIEPFMHARTVVTATEWDNFYALRRHKDAQPEIKALADAMWDAMYESRPKYLKKGQWHAPYYRGLPQHMKPTSLAQSVARCARVSYNTHEGRETTEEDDVRLANRLADSGHWSPFEHQATPIRCTKRSNNFFGWQQYREQIENERQGQVDSGCSERQEV